LKFNVLHVENFLTIGKATVNLRDRGLHIIQGVNDADSSADSNGAGKSTLVDAICWVLFGTTARNVKGDKVVNRTAKKNTFVKLSLIHGETVYSVERFRKHKDHKNSLYLFTATVKDWDETARMTNITRGTEAETQKALEKILGCTLEVFMAAVYSGQEAMPDLPTKTDKELKTLVEEGAGMRRIEAAYEVAKERRTTATRDVDTITARLETTRAALTRAEASLLTARETHLAWEGARAARVAEAQTAQKAKEDALMTAGKLLLEAKSGHDAAVLRLAEIDKELDTHGELERVARAAEKEHQDALRGVERHKLDAANEKLANLRKNLDEARAGRVVACTACGASHSPENLEKLVAHIEGLITAAELELADIKKHLLEQAKKVTWVAAKATTARKAVPDVTAITTERTAQLATVQRFQNGRTQLERMKNELVAAKAAVAARQEEPNPHASAVAMVESQVAEHASKVGELTEALATKQAALEIAESVVRVFGPAGVRAQILDTVTPLLNERTSDYLSVLSDGNLHATWTTLTRDSKGELKEKFSIEVTNDEGADSFAGLSGGEKRKVRLACALALQDLVASRATLPLDLWIGDEIDDALDRAGLERLMTILERKARERGTVLVISHNELRDWCDEVTVVRKTSGASTVEGSLCV
jgi:DNA repair exonuclease SbcCD ATPase subunit